MADLLLIPKMDIIFKRIFGDERNKKILISLLNAVLGIKKSELLDLTILNNELLPEFQNEKQGILDMRIRLTNGELINVEIQIFPYESMRERIIYYLSRMFVSQIEKGINYRALKKCINITILDYNLTKGNHVHSIYHLNEDENDETLTDILEIHLLELRKFKNTNDDILSLWLQFIKSTKREEFEMVSLKDEDIQKAYEVLEELNRDPKLKEYYEMLNKWDHDRDSMIYDAKTLGYKEGIEKGLETGKEEGREEGRKEGREEGKKKVTEAHAIKMLKANIDLEVISEVTGLSVTELTFIKDNT